MMEKRLLPSTLLKVDISDIDLNPGPFCMSFNFNLEPLKTSIDKFGVLNPPYLLKSSDNNFIVVAGYRRLLAVRELGWHDIVCQILPDSFPPLNALLLNLNDNLIHRRLNSIEKGMVLPRLARFLKEGEIVNKYMPILGLPSSRQTLELFKGLEKLEDIIKASIATEKLSLRVVGLMRDIAKVHQLKIHNLLTMLKWSFNQQWEITQWIIEIASREGRSIKEVIDEREIREVLKNTRMNKPQKIKAIMRILKERRFPTLIESEKLFKKGLSNLALPSRVRIIPPPFFEGIDYKLEIVFQEGVELKDKLNDLCRLPGLEKVTDFWKA